MTGAGWLHVFGVALAAVAAMSVFARAKGTTRHRVIGRGYVLAMLLVNAAAFAIHQDTPGWGPFHILAVVSLATLTWGIWAIRSGPRTPRQMAIHGHVMSWSVAGLASAGVGQLAGATGVPVWPTILLALAAGGWLIHRGQIQTITAPLYGD